MWQSTVNIELVEKVWAKIPAVPRVYGRSFLLLDCAKVELVSISTFEEYRARAFVRAFRRTLDQYLSCPCLDCADINELVITELKSKLLASLWNHVLGNKGF